MRLACERSHRLVTRRPAPHGPHHRRRSPRRDRHDDRRAGRAPARLLVGRIRSGASRRWTVRRGPRVTSFGPQIEVAIARVRADVARLHGELTAVRAGRVDRWQRSRPRPRRRPVRDQAVGVSYDDLAPENMILCDLDGNVDPRHAGSDRSPSSDTAAHAYVYRNMPEVGGVVHTHSTYATAWAARGEQIPCVITAMADEFGRADPGRPVRDHRRRLDRPRHRRDADRPPVPCGADAEPRAVHDRGERQGRGQGA